MPKSNNFLPINQDANREAAAEPNASQLLTEVQDEQQWDTSFRNTTDEQWEQMTDMVRQEISKNKTVSLNQIFPS